MKNYNDILILMIVGLTLFFCVAAQSDCQSKNKKEQDLKNTNKTTPKNTPDEKVSSPNQAKMKTINEGMNSKIEKPFIFVARSAETYAQMNDFVENLPPVSRFDFDKSAIVAAFAGTKSSGGYSVEINKATDKFMITLTSPPEDAMTAQALTAPYKIVLMPIEAEENLSLDIAENWKNVVQTYKVSSGEFEYSGGITGRAEKFKAEGTIHVLSFGDFATLIFDLSGKDNEKPRKLNAAASGRIKNEKVELNQLDAGSFSESPKPPVKVSGKMTISNLNLVFEPLPTNVADGFQLRGKVEAVKIK